MKTSLLSNLFSGIYYSYNVKTIIFLIVLIIRIFNPNILVILVSVIKWFIILGFIYQTLGLASRWIISGHAPWSNGYESMIYISWATMLAGIIFSRRSKMTLAATTLRKCACKCLPMHT